MKTKIIVSLLFVFTILISGCIAQNSQNIKTGKEVGNESEEVVNKTPVNLAEALNKTDQEVCEMTEGKWINNECVCPEGYRLDIYKNAGLPPLPTVTVR